jgi:hypothetical protein
MKIDFICVGAPKCGTTWLYENMRRHRHIELPRYPIKETEFFDQNFHKGEEWYKKHFDMKEDVKRGEVAPTLFKNKEAASRLKKFSEKTKIIIITRDPVDQCRSLFLHYYKKGRVSSDFREAINAVPDIIESCRYSEKVPIWMNNFDDVLVMKFENLKKDQDAFYKKILNFLEVEENTPPLSSRVNKTNIPRSRALRKVKAKIFRLMKKGLMFRTMEVAKKISNLASRLITLESKDKISEMEGKYPDREARQIFQKDKEYLENIIYTDSTQVYNSLPDYQNL